MEPHTATALIRKANTRVFKGDRFKLVGFAAPLPQPVGAIQKSPTTQASQTVPANLVASKLKIQDTSGQSRLNLGDLAKFLHYDSGDAAIKPGNYKVLDQLIDYLHTSGDMRMIRIEGHADNMEIGPSLKSRYPSNLELSKVRAHGVLRYLIEKGGVEPKRISAVGLGDTKPTATNMVEDGRTKNRRVEILLYTPDTETPAPTPEIETQVQKPEGRLSTVSARDNNDQPLPATTSAMTDSPGQGTMATGDSPETPSKDRSNPANNPDESGSTSPDTNKKDSPPQQPTAGTQTE